MRPNQITFCHIKQNVMGTFGGILELNSSFKTKQHGLSQTASSK